MITKSEICAALDSAIAKREMEVDEPRRAKNIGCALCNIFKGINCYTGKQHCPMEIVGGGCGSWGNWMNAELNDDIDGMKLAAAVVRDELKECKRKIESGENQSFPE